MTLCDAGPLFALVDPRQAEHHKRCRAALPGLKLPLITTWPCFTEAMYLAHRAGGWPMQQLLWRMLQQGILVLHDLAPDEQLPMASLMERYRDTPMDLADASLVTAAESLSVAQIFTLDSDFLIYRFNDNRGFEIIP